jgi:outer membrane receptor for ferrienterochelin and colicin
MIKRFTLMLFSVVLTSISIMAQTSLEGRVVTDGGEPVIFAAVALYQNDRLVTGTQTDFDGYFAVTNLSPGTYDVEASYVGLQTTRVNGVVVNANQANRIEDIILAEGVLIDEVVVVDYKVPLIDKDATSTGGIVTAEKIRNLPVKDINSIASQTAGIASQDGGDINIRGARSNQTNYYIDGIRVNGKLPPQTEIEQLQVLTGGISAKYGDVTGGIISITTKGPSDKYSGYLEAETSEFLDPYGFTLLNASVSGPIVKNSKGNTVLGFRAAAQYNFQRDDDPPAQEIFRASEETIDRISANPITLLQGSPIPTAERLTTEDGSVEVLDYQPNEEQRDLDLVAKLEARLSDNIDISLTGTYNNATDRFSPGATGSNGNLNVFRGIGRWDLLNWVNNPMEQREVYRGVFRFRHRLGQSGIAALEEDQAKQNTSIIQNASYYIQLGFERRYTTREDWRHEDRLFDYGYIGDFDVRWDTTYAPIVDSVGNVSLIHTGFNPTVYGFNPSDVNQAMANYNNYFTETPESIFGYTAFNGTVNDVGTNVWNVHINAGSVYNRFRKQEQDRLQGNIALNFDIVPGGTSKKGRHNIELGVTFEQWVERVYEVRPFGLWTLARLYANEQILGLGTDTAAIVNGQVIFANNVDQGLVNDPERQFFRSVRALKFPGVDINTTFDDYVNVDDIDPSQLSLDMFSARELTDQNIISYYGYDYLGNKTGLNSTFEDFFARDENGARSFNVAPVNPLYGAIYIQDRFTFKDIIFRLGLRADYYDANAPVLRDQFSLYPIMDAETFHNREGTTDRPGSVGAGYKVYVEEPGSNVVKAYRNGDEWFDPSGTQVDPRTIFGEGGLVTPRYNVDDDTQPGFDAAFDPKSAEFDPSLAFEDYTPQWNLMPRLGFSFPISDEANFFAHYDVLVSRPLSRNIATALDYFYWKDAGRTPQGNPNLRPVRTIDYQVGFQQKLTNTSAIKLAAYYKEFRDLIQQRNLLFTSPAPVNNFFTFDNLDFGTVKGFTFQYDLRRTGNIELTAAYTLQFADGTGSDDDSQQGLTNRGLNIRTLAPLTFDERHRIVATIDYRYESGKKYNGPRWFGVDFLANTGFNMQLTTVSGRPYTERITPTRFGGSQLAGSINGARLPWTFRADIRVDKTFRITPADAARPLFVNVYFRAQNIFDTRNIVSVYTATGSPEDDGFLNFVDGLDAIANIEQVGRANDVQFFIEQYNWRLLNPDNFARPRRMYIGAIFEF